ncbi:coiled-coil domain-containing protein 33 isoform X2 [Antennarius striatus]|uniref:coiled-coil domain-containing protein 33 isoform X2 n=1 Tax=Antennarius striatus TaxID=241820 RepID=UPI0035B0F3A3
MRASAKMTPLHSPAAMKKEGFNLPSHDALAQILPKYQTLFGEKTELQQKEERQAERPKAPQANKPNINHTYHVHPPHKRPPLHDFKDDPRIEEITDLQAKEVENYRSAMSKMAEDIILLRTQIVTLEAENSQLRISLSSQHDLGRDLPNDADVDVMTKAEMADCIASLKFKLASESSKAASRGDAFQQLQNDLIQKKKGEEEPLRQTLQQQQHVDLQLHQNCLAKTTKLEAKVKQQEKVIEKMEKALDKKLLEINKQSGDKKLVAKKDRGGADQEKEEVKSDLAAENTRLREELDRIHQQSFPNVPQPPAPAKTEDALQVKDRLSLLNQLERAEERVRALEAQRPVTESLHLKSRQKKQKPAK